jgi:RHS repeat-associated protein
VRFAGQLSKPASVTVGGAAATVASRNRFEAQVNMSPGPQTVPVIATDPSDNSSVTHNYQVNVTAGSPRSYGRDNNGNITSSSSPDGGGAPNATYEWDAADRLSAINIGTHRTDIQYDGLGRRVHLTERDSGIVASEKRFLWSGNELCEERDAAGGSVKRHLFSQGEERIGGSDAGVYFYTRDHLGSIRELVDGSGAIRASYDYGIWGQRTKLAGDLDTDLGFTGFYFHSQSGLSFSRTRAYDCTLGKWINRDPIKEAGGFNLQMYVFNNPTNFVDPLGLSAALAWSILGRALVRAGVVEAAGLGPENPIADAIATGILAYGLYEAIKALNENQANTPPEKSCPIDLGGATNPNTPDPNDPGGDLRKVSDSQLKNDGIDAHSVKNDFLGNQGGKYNISTDSQGNVQLTPVKPGAAPNVNTGLKYTELSNLYPL